MARRTDRKVRRWAEQVGFGEALRQLKEVVECENPTLPLSRAKRRLYNALVLKVRNVALAGAREDYRDDAVGRRAIVSAIVAEADSRKVSLVWPSSDWVGTSL